MDRKVARLAARFVGVLFKLNGNDFLCMVLMMNSAGKPSITCRFCGQQQSSVSMTEATKTDEHAGFASVLDLGCTPLANRILQQDELHEPDPVFPLRLVFCRKCGLLQITETVPPETLFRQYAYFSSFSDTRIQSCRTLTERLIQQRGLKADSLVLEAGSNDGYLLQHFAQRGIPVLGIDPARNVADAAIARDVPTLAEFFSAELATRLVSEGKSADVIFANNVLAHVPDLNGFVQGI